MAEMMCPIRKHAEKTPEAPAVITDEKHYTYHELDAIIKGLITQLGQLHVKAGSRVAFVAPTSVLTAALFFALFRLKAIACPLSFRLPASQIDGSVKRLCATHVLDMSQLRLTQAHHEPCDQTWDPSRVATFLFTSGSSGLPKIACHSLANHLYSAYGAIPAINITANSRYLLSLPLFHVSGISILFRTVLSGCPLVITELPLHISLNLHQITHASFVPTQLYRLMQDLSWHPTQLRCALIGGAALSLTLHNQALLRGLPIIPTYGMTEMSSMIACDKPIAGTELKRDRTGELFVRGRTLFKGYWNSDTQTCDLPLNEGWFATGDLGEPLDDGSWILRGRKDRLFISGGENVQPEEIEHALCQLPGIFAARVEPRPDPEFGQRPIAYLLEGTPQYTLETIQELLRTSLPSFKHPIQIYPFTDEMLMRVKVPLKR